MGAAVEVEAACKTTPTLDSLPPDGKKGGGLVAGERGLMSPSQELHAPWWRFK